MNSWTSPVDIRPDHLAIVQGILRVHLPAGFKVWVFGSRANWTTKDSSDLDLAVEGAVRLDHKSMIGLEVAFEESDLPHTVDVVDLKAVSSNFRQIVEGQRVLLPSMGGQVNMCDRRHEVALGDVCTKIGSGATPRGGKDVYLEEGGYTLIRSQNVHNDSFHRGGLVFIGEDHANELQHVEVFEEDVLLNITGDSVARVCQVAPDVLPARVNQHVAIIRPDPADLEPSYLRYYLASPAMQTLLLSWAGSGATRNALTKAMIESLEISLPPLSEQRAIAHVPWHPGRQDRTEPADEPDPRRDGTGHLPRLVRGLRPHPGQDGGTGTLLSSRTVGPVSGPTGGLGTGGDPRGVGSWRTGRRLSKYSTGSEFHSIVGNDHNAKAHTHTTVLQESWTTSTISYSTVYSYLLAKMALL